LIDLPISITLAQLEITGGWNMKFKPLGERALIKPVEREEQSASGIVLPDTAKKRPQTAEVVAVGDGHG
jgi:co-chaperonin GroES (HSP10)